MVKEGGLPFSTKSFSLITATAEVVFNKIVEQFQGMFLVMQNSVTEQRLLNSLVGYAFINGLLVTHIFFS